MGGLWRNPKMRRLSNESLGVLVRAWSYAADEMTDGRVPVDMLEMWARPKRWPTVRAELTSSLAGNALICIEDGAIDAVCHGWSDVNITAEAWEKRLESDRKRKHFPTGNPTGNSADIPTGIGAIFQGCALDEDEDDKSSSDEEDPGSPSATAAPCSEPAVVEAPRPDPGARIEELSRRYPASLLVEVRAACARSRSTGRMADSVWLATLEKLDAFALDVALGGMQTFADRYADGSRDERYLLGIVRNERQRETRPARRSLVLALGEPARRDELPEGLDTWDLADAEGA
jgi:hypothetical protein